MPLLGAHQSIAGGYYRALERAQKVGCQTVQVFTKNSNQWKAKEITEADVSQFRKTLRASKLRIPIAHDSYLINLASPDETLWRRSLEALVEECCRAERLGLHYLVTHPGAFMDSDENAGIARVTKALDELHQRCPNFRVRILLENTAGQGSSLGHRFEHLGEILSGVRDPTRLGVCFDTCHAFAAGYGLSSMFEYQATMGELDRTVGLRRIYAFHLNDSRKPQGSRVDRHAHIGEGCLGLEPFRLLLNDRRFRARPMILETPKEDRDGVDMDSVNLKRLQSLLQPPKS